MIRFTLRQLDILRLVAQGLTNYAIGSALNISEQTVKNHLTLVYRGLGERIQGDNKRYEAVLCAVKAGYLSLEEIGGQTNLRIGEI